MYYKLGLTLLVFLTGINFYAQESFEWLLSQRKTLNFHEITQKSDVYFQNKHPNLSKSQLSSGAYRDGEFVKYMRWKSFWQNRLDAYGNLADLSKNSQQLLSKKNQQSVYTDLQWKNISYKEDLGVQIGLGRTNAIGFHPTDPDIFYVGAAIGGIWKTTDGGKSYTALGDQLPHLAVSAISVSKDDPNTIYIAISDRVWYGPSALGIYKSMDGGATWNPTALRFNYEFNARIFWMETHPNDSNIMYVATEVGLYKTIDGFNTFEQIASGDITDVKLKPNDPSTIYYVNRNTSTFYKSSNNGTSFEQIEDWAGRHYMRIAVSPLNQNLVYVGFDKNLYTSSNAGDSFYLTSNTMPNANGILAISPNNVNTLFTGNFEVFKTNNNQYFTQLCDWLGDSNLPIVHVDQRNVFINPLQNDRIYLCNDGGVYTLNVNNDQFTNLSNGLVITQYYDIATSQTNANVVLGGSQDNGNVVRNANGIWDRSAPTGDGMTQAIDPTNENVQYYSYQNGAINRSITGSFDRNISNNITEEKEAEWETPFLLDPNDPNTIVAGYDRVYRSSDRGDNWTAISNQLANGSPIDLLTIAPNNSERIYAVENQSIPKLYVKDVNSNNWTTIALPFSKVRVTDIVVDPNDEGHLFICLGGYREGLKVYESKDTGNTWDNISANLPNIPTGAITFYDGVSHNNPPALFLGTDHGVYVKEIDMTDWEITGEFPNTQITDIEIQESENILRVGTHGRGILEAELDFDILLNTPDITLDKIKGISIYPNPASDQITIQITESSVANRFEIINALGQSVLAAQKLEKGIHQFSVSNIASGMYFIKLGKGNTNQLYKLIIK